MILVDTSVWIDFLRSPNESLETLIRQRLILSHPLVIEELACGHIRQRAEFIRLLQSLPKATVGTHFELLELISLRELYGIDIGAVDAHLIASSLLDGSKLWTNDKALKRAAIRLHIAA